LWFLFLSLLVLIFLFSEWHVRNRRSGEISLTKRMPTYYSEYTDGIKRWVELIVIADNSIVRIILAILYLIIF